MIKKTIQVKDVTLTNIHVPNQGEPKYIKQLITELKGETDKNTIITGKLSTPLSAMNSSSKQKINKKIPTLNDTWDQLGITDLYKAFHPKTSHYPFFSSTCETSSKMGHMLFFTIILWKWRPTAKRKQKKTHKYLEIKQHAAIIWLCHRRDKRDQKIHGNKKKNTTYGYIWNTAKAVIRGKFILLQDCLKNQERYQLNNAILVHKKRRKRRMNIAQSRQKEGNNKN